MRNYGKGILAGLAATVVLSVLMVMKAMMGILPALDLPRMIAGMMGAPDAPLLGWIVHFIIGVVGYGIAIAVFGNSSTGIGNVWRGIVMAMVGWLVMMVVLMPMAGAGFFGMKIGIMAPMMTLVLHIIFGAVLGWVYGRLIGNDHRLAGVRAQV